TPAEPAAHLWVSPLVYSRFADQCRGVARDRWGGCLGVYQATLRSCAGRRDNRDLGGGGRYSREWGNGVPVHGGTREGFKYQRGFPAYGLRCGRVDGGRARRYCHSLYRLVLARSG